MHSSSVCALSETHATDSRSVTVGVALGATGGSQFTAILVAICFHQMFEGLALGSRIGLLVWPTNDGWKKWAMAAGFSVRRLACDMRSVADSLGRSRRLLGSGLELECTAATTPTRSLRSSPSASSTAFRLESFFTLDWLSVRYLAFLSTRLS